MTVVVVIEAPLKRAPAWCSSFCEGGRRWAARSLSCAAISALRSKETAGGQAFRAGALLVSLEL